MIRRRIDASQDPDSSSDRDDCLTADADEPKAMRSVDVMFFDCVTQQHTMGKLGKGKGQETDGDQP